MRQLNAGAEFTRGSFKRLISGVIRRSLKRFVHAVFYRAAATGPARQLPPWNCHSWGRSARRAQDLPEDELQRPLEKGHGSEIKGLLSGSGGVAEEPSAACP